MCKTSRMAWHRPQRMVQCRSSDHGVSCYSLDLSTFPSGDPWPGLALCYFIGNGCTSTCAFAGLLLCFIRRRVSDFLSSLALVIYKLAIFQTTRCLNSEPIGHKMILASSELYHQAAHRAKVCQASRKVSRESCIGGH